MDYSQSAGVRVSGSFLLFVYMSVCCENGTKWLKTVCEAGVKGISGQR